MNHRIRAAGIIIDSEQILLVQHIDNGQEYWIPPGGRLESCDSSTVATVKREVFEETGLSAQVGQLIFVREFFEARRDTYHLELFYLIDSYKGDITTSNLEGLGGDEHLIQQVRWVSRDELAALRVFPAELRTILWDKLKENPIIPLHLGKQTETSLDY